MNREASLAALHLQGANDPRGSALDRLTHAGKALGLLYPSLDVELIGGWAGQTDLDAVSYALSHRDGSETVLTFGEVAAGRLDALDEDLQDVAHSFGESCAIDCDSCSDRRARVARLAERERYWDGAADYAMDARKDGGM